MSPHRYCYGLVGERAFGFTLYVVSLYDGTTLVHSWPRLTRCSAERKGEREVRKAQARWHW